MLSVSLAMLDIQTDRERDLVKSLFREYAPRVKAWAMRYLGNPTDAEDAASVTFLKIFRYRDKFADAGEEKIRGLIALYTKCVCFDMLRKKNGLPVVSVSNGYEEDEEESRDLELPDEVDIPAELIRQETVEVLKKAIDALPSPAREIILLRYYHDMPHSEIADVLNMNASTVRSVFQRSLAKLRKELEGYVHET